MKLVNCGSIIWIVLAVSACSDESRLPSEPELGPALGIAESRAVPNRPGPRTLDTRFAEVAAEEPTFGGAYLDEEGRRVIFVTDLTRGSEAALSLEARVPMTRQSSRTGRPPSGTVFRLADYSFSELADTRRRLRRILGSRGVRSLDIDETRNRVVIGTAPNVERVAVLNRADAVGATRAHIIVEETFEAVSLVGGRSSHFSNSLRIDQDFFWGGIQIEHVHDSVGACSLGFIAVPYGESTEEVLTASHCSPTVGSVDSGRFGQSSSSAADSFGVEVEDPATFSGTVTDTLGGDCAIGETCRWSDAALISVNNTLAKKGTIARTTGWTQYDSPVTIRSDADSLFYIDGKTDEAAYVGLELEKLGRTTGWTLGEVITTCEDREGEDGIVRLCSDVIDAGAQGGDSGAPVFYSLGDGWVTAYGILWGGRRPNWDRIVYSPFENIDYEFDPLNVEY